MPGGTRRYNERDRALDAATILSTGAWTPLGNADLHIHTRYGDGMATVPELLHYVEEHGELDVIPSGRHAPRRRESAQAARGYRWPDSRIRWRR
jgi:hypothetical protein